MGGGGAILSGTGLSGSGRDERVSKLLDTSREAVVSNNDVEKFRIPHQMHSHANAFTQRFVINTIHS